MATELVFRLIFAACWLTYVTVVMWARLKARTLAGAAATLPASRKRSVALALFAPPWFAGIILYPAYPSAIAVLSIPLPVWFRFAMLTLIVPSIPFVLWSHLALGKNWVHGLDPQTFLARTDQVLVTGGPYRYVRNPIYLGSIAFITAIALLAANWLLLVPALFLVVLVYREIPNEEAMLLERFGDKYRQYRARTPRMIPGLR